MSSQVTPESKFLLEGSKDLDLDGITPKGLKEALSVFEKSYRFNHYFDLMSSIQMRKLIR